MAGRCGGGPGFPLPGLTMLGGFLPLRGAETRRAAEVGLHRLQLDRPRRAAPRVPVWRGAAEPLGPAYGRGSREPPAWAGPALRSERTGALPS